MHWLVFPAVMTTAIVIGFVIINIKVANYSSNKNRKNTNNNVNKETK